MKLKSLIGLFVGVCLLAVLLISSQIEEVIETIGSVGWGVLLVCVFALPNLMLGAEAWRRLFPRGLKPNYGQAFFAWCTGFSVNVILPVASTGGEAAKIALFSYLGRPARSTLTTIVVDRTMQAVSMLFWGLAGILTLAAVAPQEAIVLPALAASSLMAMGIGAFMAIQISGGFAFLARHASRLVKEEKREGLAETALDMDRAIKTIYRRRGALAISATLHLAEKFVLVGEVMLASHLLGHPLDFGEALMIRAIVDAIRMIAFFIPGGLGIQESAFIALGAIFGGGPSDMLAISLVTRIREILPSIPFMIYFQVINARYMLRRRAEKAQAT